MGRLVGVLQELEAESQRDGSLSLSVDGLGITSVFGGELSGLGVVVVNGDALSFKSPPELAACGRVWMPEIHDVDGLRASLQGAHEQVRDRVNNGLKTLRRLGFKARLQAPAPNARGHISVEGQPVTVAIDQNGDLIVEEVGREKVPPEQQRALLAPEEATADEAKNRVGDVVRSILRRREAAEATNAANPDLSDDELRELHAALDDEGSESDGGIDIDDLDDDDEDDEDDEATAAGVPPPVRSAHAQPSAKGQNSPAAQAKEHQNFYDDEAAGTVQMASAPTRPPPGLSAGNLVDPPSDPRREGSLLDEFDGDDDVDLDASGFDDLDDGGDDTATRPPNARATVPYARPSTPPKTTGPARRGNTSSDDGDDASDDWGSGRSKPRSDHQSGSNEDDDEDDELLAALGNNAAPVASGERRPIDAPGGGVGLAVDDDGFADDFAEPPPTEAIDPVDDPNFAPHATRVNEPSSPMLSALPSAAPTAAFTRSMTGHPAFDDDFDDDTGAAAPRTPVAPFNPTEDDFDDGKTRALVVDEALLAALKRGEGDNGIDRDNAIVADAPTANHATLAMPKLAMPTMQDGGLPSIVVEDPAAGGDDLNRDDGRPLDPAELAPRAADELASLLDDDPILDDPMAGEASINDGAPLASGPASDVDSGFGNSGFGDARTEALQLPPKPQVVNTLVPPTVPETNRDDAMVATLEARVTALESELAMARDALVKARLQQNNSRHPHLDDSDDGTATGRADPSAVETITRSPVTPPVRPKQPTPSPVADDDAYAQVGASDEGEGVDTNAVDNGSSLPSLMSVDVHEINASRAAAPLSSQLSSQLAPSLLDESQEDDAVDEEGVSFAALQGALREMGVELDDAEDEGNATQVAASVMPFAVPDDDDGDVFGSGGSGGSFADGPVASDRHDSLPSQEMSEEATRIRSAKPTSMALVVEDPKARDRVRKHLEGRVAELLEAGTAEEVLALQDLPYLDAVVFIRPRHDEQLIDGFTRLAGLPRRPRVLVISSNEQFDGVPAVDLRVPLGRKAAEVATQVLEGLEKLGLHVQHP